MNYWISFLLWPLHTLIVRIQLLNNKVSESFAAEKFGLNFSANSCTYKELTTQLRNSNTFIRPLDEKLCLYCAGIKILIADSVISFKECVKVFFRKIAFMQV